MGVASELVAFIFPEPYLLNPGLLLAELPIADVLIECLGHRLQQLIIHSFSELCVTFRAIISFAFLVEHPVSDCLMSGAILVLPMCYRITHAFSLWAVA